MAKVIPIHRPTISKNDLISVLNCMVEEELSSNKLTVEFEKKFNQLIRARNNVLAVNNPSNALYLLFQYLEVKEGDEIILSPLADYFIYEVIQFFKLKPVWIDLELGSLLMDKNQIKEKVSEKTKVILISHLFGYPFDLESLIELNLRERNIFVIEENTASLCTKRIIGGDNEETQQVKWIGNDSDFGLYCFATHRMLTTETGSMLVTKAKGDLKALRSLRSYREEVYFDEKGGDFQTPTARLDFSFNDINAAFGISETGLLEKFIKRRREIRNYYCDVLMKTPHSFFQEEDKVELNGYAFPIQFSSGISFAKEMFTKSKIEYSELTQNTIYQHLDYMEELKVINELKLHFLQIPIYPTLKVEEIDAISKVVQSIQ